MQLHQGFLQTKEKERISDNATIGLYYFKSGTIYKEAYENTEQQKIEKYIAPMYNYIINKNKKVFIHDIPTDAIIPLGTPADVESFK